MHIMTTPNLDATLHGLVNSLVIFTFSIEHPKGWDNAATDALSWLTLKLDAETVMSILERVTIGMRERVDAHNLTVAKADEEIHKQVQETAILTRATWVHVNLHVTDWVGIQQKGPILKAVNEWISKWKVQDLKHLLRDDANKKEGKTILWEWKKLTFYQGALYNQHTPTDKLKEVLWFIVPKDHWVAAMNWCHQDAGHQGQQQTLVLD